MLSLFLFRGVNLYVEIGLKDSLSAERSVGMRRLGEGDFIKMFEPSRHRFPRGGGGGGDRFLSPGKEDGNRGVSWRLSFSFDGCLVMMISKA
jgi:hypothetical protein